jgi:hypothetical protein
MSTEEANKEEILENMNLVNFEETKKKKKKKKKKTDAISEFLYFASLSTLIHTRFH